ncbi:MAG: murein hydrolase activator EnvC family protein [Acidimicrobiia bacterium]
MPHVFLAAVLAAAPALFPLSPPADGPVERAFEAPSSPYGPGHRGIDYATRPGTPVRAAADGLVVFAGPVAGSLHVVVSHGRSWLTSYGYLAGAAVEAGQTVGRGDLVGVSGGKGEAHRPDVVHFGLRRGARYVDPAPRMGPPLPAVHLAPLDGRCGAGP